MMITRRPKATYRGSRTVQSSKMFAMRLGVVLLFNGVQSKYPVHIFGAYQIRPILAEAMRFRNHTRHAKLGIN